MKVLYLVAGILLCSVFMGGCVGNKDDNESTNTHVDIEKSIISTDINRLMIENEDIYCGSYPDKNGKWTVVVLTGADPKKVKKIRDQGYEIEYGEYSKNSLDAERMKLTNNVMNQLGISAVLDDGKTNRIQIGFTNRKEAKIEELSKLVNMKMVIVIDDDVTIDNLTESFQQPQESSAE